MTNNNMPAWVTSNRTAFYLTLSAIVVLFPNFFYMMYKIGGDMPIPGLRLAQALIAGLYVSGSIAYFTLKGKIKVAYAFAIFEMFISFFYYWNRLMFDSNGNWHMNWYIIPACLIAMFLPWSVKNYAACVAVASVVIDNIVSDKAFNQLETLIERLEFASKLEQKITPTNVSANDLIKEGVISPVKFKRTTEQEKEEYAKMYPTDYIPRNQTEEERTQTLITAFRKKYVAPLRLENEELKSEVIRLNETIEDNDAELISAGKRIEELELDKNKIADHYLKELTESAMLNNDLESKVEQLEKEKKWYRYLASKKQEPQPEEKISPIFTIIDRAVESTKSDAITPIDLEKELNINYNTDNSPSTSL